jgi:hypothetical protein
MFTRVPLRCSDGGKLAVLFSPHLLDAVTVMRHARLLCYSDINRELEVSEQRQYVLPTKIGCVVL